MALDDSLKGFAVTFRHDAPQAGDDRLPGAQDAGLPALPRPPPPVAARQRPREVRRLLALRGRLPGRLHPGGGRGEHARAPRLVGRALRAHLRDQHGALHLLRLLRGRVPLRRDHARERVRDVRAHPRRTSSTTRRCCWRPTPSRCPCAPRSPSRVPSRG